MNEKFTPAPWLNNGRFVYSGAIFIATSSTTNVDYQKAEANAALIAAAPEMYAMLKQVAELVNTDGMSAIQWIMDNANDVSWLLAKARG